MTIFYHSFPNSSHMKRPIEITPNIRQLLLIPEFIVWVFDAEDDCPEKDVAGFTQSDLPSFLSFSSFPRQDIDAAKFILLHLDDFGDSFSKDDLEDVKNRIKGCLNG